MKKLSFLEQGFTQSGIIVPDLETAVQNYHRTFGIGPWHFYTYGKPLVQEMHYMGKPADYSMRIALSNSGPTRIELIQPLSGESIYADFIREHGFGPHHFGLYVENIQTALEEAREAGFKVIMDGSGFGPDGDGHYAYLDTESELGAIFELIERPARRHPPEKIYPAEA